MNSQFAVNPAIVTFDCIQRQEEPLADLAIGVTVGD
jgi:hypothetical protein